MSTIEYIGARYTPAFYNGNLTSAWAANTEYEPLTMVNYLGIWFISKKNVPANIGQPNINAEYWALFSATTSDLTALLRDVTDAVNNAADSVDDAAAVVASTKQAVVDFKTKGVFTGKILVIGDSYAEGWSPDGVYRSFAYLMGDYTGNAVTVYAQGGCGFGATNSDRNFSTMATQAVNEISDKDAYSLVLFAGGYNDRGHTQEAIQNGVNSAYATIRAAFTNARIAVAFIAYSHTPDYMPYTAYKNTMKFWKRACFGKNIQLVTDGWKALYNEDTPAAYMASDGRHPNGNGHIAIASFLISALNGGNVELTGGVQYQISPNSSMYIEMDNIVWNVYGATWFQTASMADSDTTRQWFNKALGTLEMADFPFGAYDNNQAYTSIGAIPAIVEITREVEGTTESKFAYVLLTLWMHSSGITFYGTALNDARNNWLAPDWKCKSIFVPNGAYRTNVMTII